MLFRSVSQSRYAGLNPALLNGGSGSAGQARGATVEPATAMQPMGLQVALQAQQTAAQTALTNAQAEKIRSETTAQKVENLVGVGIDLARKVAEVRKNKNFTDEMAKKTVINRLCKSIINSSDDTALFDDEKETTTVYDTAEEEIIEKENKLS